MCLIAWNWQPSSPHPLLLIANRDPANVRVDAPSRGELVSAFLQANTNASDYLTELAAHAASYNPFNLLVFDGTCLMGLQSRHAKVVAMHPGLQRGTV